MTLTRSDHKALGKSRAYHASLVLMPQHRMVLLSWVVIFGLLGPCLPGALLGQTTSSISGKVIDRESLQPVPGVQVSIESIGSSLTDENGFFVIEGVPIGEHSLTLNHLAYGEHRRRVPIEPNGDLMIEARISPQVLELAPLVVEALSDLDRRRITSGHGMTEVRRAEIDQAARSGFDLSRLLGVMPGVLVTPGDFGQRICVQYRGGGGSGCRQVTIIVDGLQAPDPGMLFATMPLENIERIEMLSPGEAGIRYGTAAGRGVLLIETRQGPVPRRTGNVTRNITGFDWSEEMNPYPWFRVYGSSFIGNTVGVGVGLILANRCFSAPNGASMELRIKCGGLATVGSALLSLGLPAVGGSFGARLGGGTERSTGRFGAATIATSLALTAGYVFLIEGGTTSQVLGGIVLGLGAPLLTTLSDRIFRTLR